MKKWFLYIFFLAILSTTYGQNKEANAADLYKKGLELETRHEFKSAINRFLEVARVAKDHSELQLRAVYKLAYFDNYTDKKDKQEIYKMVSRAVRSLLQFNRSDTLSADLYFRAGQVYRIIYQPDSALLCYDLAIRRYDQLYGRESVSAADCYLGSGSIYESFFYDYSKAESLYEHALTIRERLPPGEVANFMIGVIYANLVEVNRKQKDLDKALFYELKNIGFAESIIKTYPEFREHAYEGLAITYGDLGQFNKARSYYQKAIAVNEQLNHGAANALLGNYYESLGELNEKEKSIEAAIRNYLKAEKIFSLANSRSPKYIKTIQQLGKLYAEKDELKSLQYLKTGLSLISKYALAKSGQATELNVSMGDYFTKKHKVDSALLFYQRALQSCSVTFSSLTINDNPIKNDITLKDYAFEVLLRKANLLSAQFTLTHTFSYAESAMECYALAEKLLSESRIELDTDHSKWNFFDSNFDLYEQTVSLLFKMNQLKPSDSLVNRAFYYMESSKSKTLSDALNQAEFSDPLIGGDTLIHSLNEQKRRLHFFNDQLKKIDQTVDENQSMVASLGNSMIAADRAIQETEKQLNRKYPSYLSTKYRNQVYSMKSIQHYAQGKNAFLVEYFWGVHDVFAIGISTTEVQFKRIGRADSIENKLKIVLQHLNNTQNDYSSATVSTFISNCSYLYQFFLQPFEKQLKSNDHLIVIPDGLIGQLPFEILNASVPKRKDYRSLNYLVKTHFVSYSFSSAYLLSEERDRLSSPRLLAFGYTDGKQLRSGIDEHNRDAIIGSEKEIEALSGEFPDGIFLKGDSATEQRFKGKAPFFDILHLAVHGQGDTEQNYSAGLYFRDTISGKEDGKLNWYELFDMRLKAKLVVISSCESGIGKTYRGEGMLSMANAFAYAGCRNVVMGLWKVDDHVSILLMETFYKKISRGETVDDALTYAKRAYLSESDELSANPKMWASLVAYGDDAIMADDNSYFKYITLLLSLLVVGFILFTLFGKPSFLNFFRNIVAN